MPPAKKKPEAEEPKVEVVEEAVEEATAEEVVEEVDAGPDRPPSEDEWPEVVPEPEVVPYEDTSLPAVNAAQANQLRILVAQKKDEIAELEAQIQVYES